MVNKTVVISSSAPDPALLLGVRMYQARCPLDNVRLGPDTPLYSPLTLILCEYIIAMVQAQDGGGNGEK